MLEMEPIGPNNFLCNNGRLEMIAKHHRDIGNKVADPVRDKYTDTLSVTVSPKDGSARFRVTEKLPGAGESIVSRPGGGLANPNEFEWLRNVVEGEPAYLGTSTY